MEITGIICEYNPLHSGHKKQLDMLRGKKDAGVVCLMSGNFVQRGEPAIIDKSLRAKAAVLCGADLVLEMPVTASLSSAEGFAAKCVKILSPFCDNLSFGAEHPDPEKLLSTASVLLSPAFPDALKAALDTGVSFPAARQKALENMACDSSLLQCPNDILAVEYCKAILSQNSSMQPLPHFRGGDYHAGTAHPDDPSATSLRQKLLAGDSIDAYIPSEAAACYEKAAIHSLKSAERAILGKLRTMTEEEFQHLPYGSEGLWRKLMHASRKSSCLEELFSQVKSKRYTYTRISRMVLCAFLGITEQMLQQDAPYVRVLAFNQRGREILKKARTHGQFLNAGEKTGDPWETLEHRCGDLYGLFAAQTPEPPGAEEARRVIYIP